MALKTLALAPLGAMIFTSDNSNSTKILFDGLVVVQAAQSAHYIEAIR